MESGSKLWAVYYNMSKECDNKSITIDLKKETITISVYNYFYYIIFYYLKGPNFREK